MIINLLNFNNYYDRTFKSLNKVEDYSPYVITTQQVNNFNENDGVTTSVVINMAPEAEAQVNYVILTDDSEAELISRWFIIDAKRNRKGQYEVTLRRDLIAEYYNDIVMAPTFIEKALVGRGNSLIFNSEDMTFSQVKKQETKLTDRSLCPWIVGYMSKKVESKRITSADSVEYAAEYPTLADLPLYEEWRAGQSVKTNLSNVYAGVRYAEYNTNGADAYETFFNEYNNWYTNTLKGQSLNYNQIYTIGDYRYTPNLAGASVGYSGANYYSSNKVLMNEAIKAAFPSLLSSSDQSLLLNTYTEAGTVVKVGDTIYRLKRSAPKTVTAVVNAPSIDSELATQLAAFVEQCPILKADILANKPRITNYIAKATYTSYNISIEPVATYDVLSTTIPAPNSRNHLNDAPYDMFAIPYNLTTKLSAGYDVTAPVIANCDATASMNIALKLVEELTQDNIYDLQLLPYCPLQDVITLGTLHYPDLQLDRDYSYIYRGNPDADPKEIGIIFWLSRSQFSFTLDKYYEQQPDRSIIARPLDIKIKSDDPKQIKVQALCEMHRLVSPNYNGQFEFNAVKNDGVEYFQVDCTYKPYQPYIRVAPNFKGLYGAEYGDARGLICGGDFSLATLTDQWKQYEINNKNYLNAFDRQIENLEINNKYQRQADIWQAVAGTLQGATSGATVGMVAGGGLGAGIGAGLGGVASGIAGIADVNINEKLRAEALDFTQDQFGYTLGNIRALPYALNRVSSFNINNKLFPILEYYEAPEHEQNALYNKLQFNGMTIMTIGRPHQYLLSDKPTYLKGKLIRLEGYNNHTTIEIANELNKGLFFNV